MKRTRNPRWRDVTAALLLVLVLAATPAVAQASTGAYAGSSWIGWLVAQVESAWQQLAAEIHTDNQAPDPKPGP